MEVAFQDVLVSVWVFFSYYSAVINMKLKYRAGGSVYKHNSEQLWKEIGLTFNKMNFSILACIQILTFWCKLHAITAISKRNVMNVNISYDLSAYSQHIFTLQLQ